MPLLRVEIGDRRLRVVLRHDVPWQQTLPPLRRIGHVGHGRATYDSEVRALPD